MSKLEQAARQALDALEMHAHGAGSIIHTKLAWDALQEALAEKAGHEPDVVGAYEVWDKDEQVFTLVYPQAIHKYNLIPEESITRTFYASPVRTKDLTDEEIWEAYSTVTIPVSTPKIGRAVIAADREKNK